MKELSVEEMNELNGGLTWGCALALAGYGLAIGGVAITTGGVGAIVLAQLSLYAGAAGIICSCSNYCG